MTHALRVRREVADRPDEPHAGPAERAARARQLRREIRCASGVTTPSGYPRLVDHDHARRLLPDGRRTPRGDRGARSRGPLRRSPARSPTRSGGTRAAPARAPGRSRRRTSSTRPTSPSVTAGKIFGAASRPAASLSAAVDGRDASSRGPTPTSSRRCSPAAERSPGRSRRSRSRAGANQITLSWSPYVGSDVVQRLRPGRRRPAPADERHVRHLVRRHRPTVTATR